MLRSISALCATLVGWACLGQYGCASDPAKTPAGPDYYPADSLRRGDEGVTVVKVCVNDGKVSSVTLVTSSGHEELDRATMSNMRTKEMQDSFLSHPPAGVDPSAWCKNIKTAYSAHAGAPQYPQRP